MTLLAWAALILAVVWVARLLHTACTRLLPVATLVTAWLVLSTPPGRVVSVWAAEWLIVLTQLLAWAVAPLVAVWLLVRAMARLGRRRARPGSVARWVSLWLVLGLGVVAVLLLHRLIGAAEPVVRAGFAAVVEAGWWLVTLLLGP